MPCSSPLAMVQSWHWGGEMDSLCPCPISVRSTLERSRRAWEKGGREGRNKQEHIKRCLFSPTFFG